MTSIKISIILLMLSKLIVFTGCAVDDVINEQATSNGGYLTVIEDTKSIEIGLSVTNIGTYGSAEYYGVRYDLLDNTNKSILFLESREIGDVKTECIFVAMTGGNINEYVCNTTFDLEDGNEGIPSQEPKTIYLEVGKIYRGIMTELVQYGAHEDDVTALGSFIVQ